MKKKKGSLAIAAIATLMPSITLAASSPFTDFVYQLIDLVGMATTVLIGAAMLIFFVGVARSLWASRQGDAAEQERLKDVLLWGVITIFVMASIWGIIAVLQQTLQRGL